MTLLSLDMTYRLYGTISVNAIFLDFLLLWSGPVCASALIVRHKLNDGCNRAGVGSKTVRGELAIQRRSSRRILVFGRSYGTRTMMQ